MKQRRILALVAVVGVAAAGLLALYAPSTPPQVVTLPDGSRLTLQGVTVSRHPRYCFGNPFQKLGAALPGKLGMKLGGNSVCDAGQFEQPVLTFWFSFETTNIPQRIVCRDSSDRPWMNLCFFLRPVAGRNFGFVTCEVWPRRDKSLSLDFYGKYQYAQTNVDARLVVPNPSYGKYPQWTPERLPASRRVGQTEFTLESVEVEWLPWVFNVDRFYNIIRVSTKAMEDGVPTDAWGVSSLAFADATGNALENLGKRGSRRAPYWPAMPSEDAVKLQVEFVKANGFGSNDIFVVHGVPVPPPPPYRFITNLPAGRLVLRTTPNYVEAIAPSYGGTDTNWSSRRFILLSAVDDRGFKAAIAMSENRLHFGSGAKRLDITVAAPPALWLEWIVPAGGTVTNAASR